MNKKISIWNGYPVHGDVKELDRIVESNGSIGNFDKKDIIEVFYYSGNNYVTTGFSDNIDEALTEATRKLPYKIEELDCLLFILYCSKMQPESVFSYASKILSDANGEMVFGWNLISDDSLGNSFKVVLVASVGWEEAFYNTSTWKGYPVHGDAKELNFMTEAEGMINLDKDDIVSVLSSEGENWIAVGAGIDMCDAFNEAVNRLPCGIDKVDSLLIEFCYGSRQPVISEFSAAKSALSDANADLDIIWGVANDESLGESSKVILVASVKA